MVETNGGVGLMLLECPENSLTHGAACLVYFDENSYSADNTIYAQEGFPTVNCFFLLVL